MQEISMISQKQRYITIKQFSDRFNIGQTKTREFCRTDGFPAFKFGGKIYIAEDEAEMIIRKKRVCEIN